MKPADRSRVRTLARALKWDWEEPDGLLGHAGQMFGGDLDHIRIPMDRRHDWSGPARQPLASNPFEELA